MLNVAVSVIFGGRKYKRDLICLSLLSLCSSVYSLYFCLYMLIYLSVVQVQGMSHVAPKARGGRSGDYFAINDPGREPFYVHAYHAGDSQQSANLQVRTQWFATSVVSQCNYG